MSVRDGIIQIPCSLNIILFIVNTYMSSVFVWRRTVVILGQTKSLDFLEEPKNAKNDKKSQKKKQQQFQFVWVAYLSCLYPDIMKINGSDT